MGVAFSGSRIEASFLLLRQEMPTILIFQNHTDFQGRFPHYDLEREKLRQIAILNGTR